MYFLLISFCFYRNLLDYWCIINKNLRESEYDIGGTNDRVQLLNPAEWIGDDPGTNNKDRRANEIINTKVLKPIK